MRNFLFVPLLFLCACGADRSPDSFLDGKVHERRPVDWPIDIFYGEKPTKPYTEIRWLRVEGNKEAGALTAEFRGQARKFGGDAVIISSVRGHKGDISVWTGGGDSKDIVEGVLIIYNQSP